MGTVAREVLYYKHVLTCHTSPDTTTTIPDTTECQCADITVKDGNSGKNIGNCLTQYNDKFWCYVTSTSTCEDKSISARSNGLFFSFTACKGKFYDQPQPVYAL